MKLNFVDLFCGAGGESTGISQAMNELNYNYDLAAVNHWDMAIETHKKNHPSARHYCANVEHLNPHDIFSSNSIIDGLWASPECTHHSRARGGKPMSNQSRASAWLILKWLSEFYVKRVFIENVPEFVDWGPLGTSGRPLKSKKGSSFNSFISALQGLGYKVEYNVLCAANYGDPTIRRRLFIQAVRGHGKITWPEHTHSEFPDLFSKKPWVTAKDIIDFDIHGKSIFGRKRPLADATLNRIEHGIKKYWGKYANPFLIMLRGTGNSRDIKRPIPAITSGGNHIGLIEPFLIMNRGESLSRETKKPVPTITAGGGHVGIVQPFILNFRSGIVARSIEEPLSTITAGGIAHAAIQPFLIRYNGKSMSENLSKPVGALSTRDRFAMVNGDKSLLDITLRMLNPSELAAAQGFPRNYEFSGNINQKVKQIGNAVPVNTAKALILNAYK